MKYINTVILENFQSHKYSEIEFNNGLNVIVGPSDQGKSAIIRGIKWALFNEPSGDYFIREGESDCSVTLVFSDNTKIKRYRSKSKNLYYLYDPDGKETIFEGFGTNVPYEIIDKTNIKKIYLDGKQSNSINISDQLEGSFLLSEKSATRANAIGRLVGVHLVDDAISDTLKDIRNLGILKKTTNEQLEKQIEEMEKYDYLSELEQTIKKLEINKNKIANLKSSVDKLNSLSITLKKLNADIKQTQNIIIKLDNIKYISSITKELNIKIKLYILISNKFKYLLDIKNNICYNENIINKTKDIDLVTFYMKTLEQIVLKRSKLIILQTKKHTIEENLKYNKNILMKLESLNKVNKNVLSIDYHYKKLENLNGLYNKKREIDKRITFGTNYLDEFLKIDNIDIKLISLEKKYIPLCNLTNIKKKKEMLLTELKKTKISLNNLDEETKRLLLTYKNLLSRFEVCPLCLSKIDKNTIDKIVETYK